MEFSVITITTFVGLMNQGLKYITKTFIKRDVSKFIPICSVIFGILLGISGYFIPSVEMGNNIIEAIFMGAAAGGSATAVHQSYKQLSKQSTDNTTTVDECCCDCECDCDEDEECDDE